MSNLLLYCGWCRKPVAVVDLEDDFRVIFGTTGHCPKCGCDSIQNDQVVLRDSVMDECFVLGVEPKPVPKTVPNFKKYEVSVPTKEVEKTVQVAQMKGLIDIDEKSYDKTKTNKSITAKKMGFKGSLVVPKIKKGKK